MDRSTSMQGSSGHTPLLRESKSTSRIELTPAATPLAARPRATQIAPATGSPLDRSDAKNRESPAGLPGRDLRQLFSDNVRSDSDDEIGQPVQIHVIRAANQPQHLPVAMPAPAAQTLEQLLQARKAEKTAACSDWRVFCEDLANWQDLPDSALKDHRSPEPNTRADVQALRNLINAASGLAQTANPADLPQSRRRISEQLNRLFEVYKSHTPEIVFNSSVTRTATTLQTLLEAGITPEKLKSACFWAKARDVTAQLFTSEMAYASGFLVLTGATLGMTEGGASPEVRDLVAPLMLVATSLPVASLLREGQMHPSFTRPVELDDQGNVVHALATNKGFWKVSAQFFPFLGTLGYVDSQTRDPASTTPGTPEFTDAVRERAVLRMASGIAASAGVGLYRMFGLKREHVWLDASTPEKAEAMLGAIERVTRPGSVPSALYTYLVDRPLAGLTGSVSSSDLIPQVNEWEEWRSGHQPDPQTAPQWPQRPPHLPQPRAVSAQRVTRELLPLAALGLTSWMKGFLGKALGPGFLSSGLTDAFLLLAWGPAVAAAEWITTFSEPFRAGNAFRATQEQVANRRYAPAPGAVAPAAGAALMGQQP